jgi:hypothetical protein
MPTSARHNIVAIEMWPFGAQAATARLDRAEFRTRDERFLRVVGVSAPPLKLDANLWMKRMVALREQPFGFCLRVGRQSCFLFSPRDSVEDHAHGGSGTGTCNDKWPEAALAASNVIRGLNQLYMIDTDEFLDGAASVSPRLPACLRRLSQ